jgi:hypothetical protein
MTVESGSVIFKDCDLYRGKYIFKTTGGSLTVEKCYMHLATYAMIYAGGTSIVHVTDCELRGCSADDGIGIKDKAHVFIENCLIHEISDEGISSHDDSYVEVRNCEVCYCGYRVGSAGTIITTEAGAESSYGGIHLGGGGMGKVIGCYSHHNRTYGIAMYHFNGGNFDDSEECTGNRVEYNGWFISGDDPTNWTRAITSDTYIAGSSTTKIADADTGSGGILICGCHDLDCSNNNVLNNAGYGIRAGLDGISPSFVELYKKCAGKIRHNYVSGNSSGNNPLNTVNVPHVDDGIDDGIVITELT